MSCDHQLVAHHVCAYIEGSLSPTLKARCEAALRQCSHCREIHDQALALSRLPSLWQQQEVPHWNRARHAVQPPRQHGQRLAWSALVASCFAVFLVLVKLEISTTDGLRISFGGGMDEARLRQVVSEQMQQEGLVWQEAQAAQVETLLSEYAERQAIATEVMLTQWLESTRSERRQDMQQLLSGWQSLRYQDQLMLNEQISYLASSQEENNRYLNALMESTLNSPTSFPWR